MYKFRYFPKYLINNSIFHNLDQFRAYFSVRGLSTVMFICSIGNTRKNNAVKELLTHFLNNNTEDKIDLLVLKTYQYNKYESLILKKNDKATQQRTPLLFSAICG